MKRYFVLAFLLLASVASAQVLEVPAVNSTNRNEISFYATISTLNTVTAEMVSPTVTAYGYFRAAQVSSAGSFTADIAGNYLVSIKTDWPSNVDGIRVSYMVKNDGSIFDDKRAGTSEARNVTSTYLIYMEAGSSIQLKIYQSSGGSMTVTPLVRIVKIN